MRQDSIKMLKYEKITTEQAMCAICDRCGREMRKDDCDGEWNARVSIAFRAGYASIFGDGNDVELDLCQHCLKDLLGQWIRVTDSFTKVAEELVQADQQTRENPQVEADLDVPERPIVDRKRKNNDE